MAGISIVCVVTKVIHYEKVWFYWKEKDTRYGAQAS